MDEVSFDIYVTDFGTYSLSPHESQVVADMNERSIRSVLDRILGRNKERPGDAWIRKRAFAATEKECMADG